LQNILDSYLQIPLCYKITVISRSKAGLRSHRKKDTTLVAELFSSWTWLQLQLWSSWFLWVWLQLRLLFVFTH